ncbi:hypothetical protein [Microcoleus sp. bin38.metabat.b11b12b14.051]|uniref:hypothetical protein n=1 Tax=Microcoleus sp. bin38.metabat.b11b12b14.051 TaxID=2742709 RepID=UPI0025D16931|nr:hypothetical protein [Microcoleus sp. bin38.metabat.b11b12b14.051]
MKAEFYYDCHRYICSLVQVDFSKELKIKNYQGFVLAVKQGEKIGLLGKSRHNAKKVDVSKPHFYNVIKAAMSALELETRNEVILERNRTIADGEEMIQQHNREIRLLHEQLRIQASHIEHLSRENQQLSAQLVEKEIRETQISQAIEEDLVLAGIEHGIGEAEIDPEVDELPMIDSGLEVHLSQNQQDVEEVEKAELISGGDVEVVDLEIIESVEVTGGESEIKHLPKRGSQRRSRKK